jgi:MoaA/NifB/PqqE/SkfB family radical SAM enzyme
MTNIQSPNLTHKQHLLRILDKYNEDMHYVQVHVTEQCNLNCFGCSHFSSIAEKEFLDVELFERDCKRLGELIDGKTIYFKLLGGEPLLHPRLLEFIDIIKKYVSSAIIIIHTNAILLAGQKESFWETCQRNGVIISISKYPVKIDFNTISQLAKKWHIRLHIVGKDNNEWRKYSLDLHGKQDVNESFANCPFDRCTQLYKGKIFVCPTIPYIRHFNKYFNQNLEITDNDWIDIHQVKNVKEITDFLKKPMSFCRYCNVKGNIYNQEWKLSKREITEWV